MGGSNNSDTSITHDFFLISNINGAWLPSCKEALGSNDFSLIGYLKVHWKTAGVVISRHAHHSCVHAFAGKMALVAVGENFDRTSPVMRPGLLHKIVFSNRYPGHATKERQH